MASVAKSALWHLILLLILLPLVLRLRLRAIARAAQASPLWRLVLPAAGRLHLVHGARPIAANGAKMAARGAWRLGQRLGYVAQRQCHIVL